MKKRHTQVFLGALTKQFFLSFLGIYMFSTLVQAQSFSEIKNIGVSGMPTNANLGWAVDVDGDFAVAAAYRDDIGGTFDAGRIFLFGRDVGGVDNWGLIRIIQASDAAASDRFGTSIEIDGDYIIVGAPDADPAGNSAGGKAYIYYRNEGGTDNWGQQASLTAFDQALSTTPKFGDDVAINGDWAVIGAPQHDQAPGVVDNTGAIYVYQRTGTTWNFVKQIIPADVLALDKFGTAVDIDGDYIVASSPSAGLAAPNGGAFYIFERNLGGSNNWGLIGRRSGSTIVADDALGNDIAISGDNIIVGAHKADDFGTSSGTAYIFSRNTPSANAWGEARQLFASSHRASDQFGWAVDIDGNLAIVGAYNYDVTAVTTSDEGTIWLYDKAIGAGWGESQSLTASNMAIDDKLGISVAIDNNNIMGGAYLEDYNGVSGSGSSYMYERIVPTSPTIYTSTTALSKMISYPFAASSVQTYAVSADNLTDNVTLTAATGIEISTDGVSFSTSLALINDGGNIDGEPVTIYARLADGNTGGLSIIDNIIHTSTGATDVNVSVEAEVLYADRGNAVRFDGGDDYLELADIDEIDNQANFSFQAWVKPLSIDGEDERIFSKRNNNSNRIEVNFGDSGGSNLESDRQHLQIHICNGANTTVSTPNGSIAMNEWQHIAVSFTGASSTLRVYINGVEQTLSGTVTATSTANTSAIARLGRRTGGNRPSNMELDEVSLWNIALDENRIRENMHLTLTGSETGLVSYYQMNEANTTGTIPDQISGYAATWGDGITTTLYPTITPSGVNTGRQGVSQQLAGVAGTGVQNFNLANLSLNITEKIGTDNFVVTYQAYTPNQTNINAFDLLSNPVWTIHSTSTENGTYIGDLTFTFPTGTLQSSNPDKYRLYYRPAESEGAWQSIAKAASLPSADQLRFTNIDQTGQFMIAQRNSDVVSGVRGKQLTFESSSNQYVDVGDRASLDMDLNQRFTISTWFKTSITGQGALVAKQAETAPNRGYSLGIIGGQIYFDLVHSYPGDMLRVLSSNMFNDGAWHHVAVTYDGSADANNVKIYVDGQEQITTIMTNSLTGSTSNSSAFTIGARDGGQFFTGAVEEVSFWNIERTLADIREDIHLTLVEEPNLVAYYQFNLDATSGTANGVKEVINGLDGTTQGGAIYQASEVAVAAGVAQTLTIPNIVNYTADYNQIGLQIDFSATNPEGDLVVYRLETEKPTGWDNIAGDVDNEYFVIRNFGAKQNFTPLIGIRFDNLSYLDPIDAIEPEISSPFRIYKRSSNAFGNSWGTALANANSATSGYQGSLSFDNSANITSFSQIVMVNIANISDLDIEWLEFDVKRQDLDQVLLTWQTASERNNEGFEVYRMRDNESTPIQIGFVEGLGNSDEIQSYTFEDDENSYSGLTYYQLKQVDTDGSFDWSALRQVDGIRLDQDIIIHPNPVLDALQLRIGQVSSQTATIQIYKMNGAFVLERSYAIEPNQVLTIDETRQFPAGSYLLKVSFDQSKDGFTKRFIIDGN